MSVDTLGRGYLVGTTLLAITMMGIYWFLLVIMQGLIAMMSGQEGEELLRRKMDMLGLDISDPGVLDTVAVNSRGVIGEGAGTLEPVNPERHAQASPFLQRQMLM